jgi:hypothetical protein
MTVSSGRARHGARSVLRALILGAAALFGLFACGNQNFINGTPVITVSATPGFFTSYVAEVDLIQLTRNDNAVAYPLVQPQIIDFAKLTDMTELFGAPAILEGTYTSAAITINYAAGGSYIPFGAVIFANVNGQSVPVIPVDSTGAAAGSVTYTIKFDPAHPLVIKRGISSPIDFHMDLSAGSLISTNSSGALQVTVHPFITASTLPVYTKPVRARGVFVTTTAASSSFTMNARAFFDTQSSPVGAIEIQTDANTTYNINGVTYTGAPGLAAIQTLQINTIIEAYGKLGDLNAQKPNFVATQVYAGVAVENVLTDRITGTVAARSGNTLTIHGAEIEGRNFGLPIGVCVTFQDDMTVTVGDSTLVTVDGHPEIQATTANISVGQQVDMEALASGAGSCIDAQTGDVTNGLVRIVPTTGWGQLTSADATTATASLFTLGGYQPQAITFAGTGTTSSNDATPGAYAINVTGIDTSSIPVNGLFRFDGMVTPFGTAPPDFTASSVTAQANAEQYLIVEWAGSGTATPFVSRSAGLVVNIGDGNLGTAHLVQTGPLWVENALTTIDFTNPSVNPTIVADPALTGQFTIGNPTSTTELSVFHDFGSFLGQLNTVLNGTNTVQKLVAVGKYDQTSNTFTAYRIDMLQLP